MDQNSKNMIKIIYEPWKTLIIHDYTQYTIEDFENLFTIASQSTGFVVPLSWANGILISATPINAEWADNEKKDGIIHWENVSFAIMPKYESHLRTKMGTIPVMDVSKHPLYNMLSHWIKESLQ